MHLTRPRSFIKTIVHVRTRRSKNRPFVNLSSFFLSFSLSGLTQDCLHRSSYFEYKSTLFCSAQCSGTLVCRYLDSYVIVGVYGALSNGCVWYAILWYNAHARNMLPWWSHVTAPGPRRLPEEVRQGHKVIIGWSRAPIYLYGSTDFTAVPQLSCYESVSIVFFVVSNTSSSPVPFVNDFVGYRLADLCDLGQHSKLL